MVVYSSGGQADGSFDARRAWVILIVIFLANMFSYMDRMLLAALAHPIQEEFSLSDTQLGMLTGLSFALFYAFMSLPLGWMTDRFSRRWMITASLGVWSAVTACTGLATSYAQLFMARVAVGIGEAGCNPASQSLIGDVFPPKRRFLASGLFNAGSMLGVTLAFAVGGWIGQTHGWRTAFIALGLPGLLLAVIAWAAIREPRRGSLDAGLAGSVAQSGESWLRNAGGLFRNRAYLLLILGNAVNTIGIMGMAQWLPQFFMRSHGMSMARIGLLFGILSGVGMFVGQMTGAFAAHRLAARSLVRPIYFSILCVLMVAPLYLAGLSAASEDLALLFIFGAAFLTSVVVAGPAAAMINAVPATVRGTAASIQLCFVSIIGMGFGPLAIGVLSDLLRPAAAEQSLKFAMMWMQVFPIVAGLIFFAAARAVAAQLGIESRQTGGKTVTAG